MKNEDILQAILAVLAIDGTLAQQELQFFDTMCRKLELSLEKRRDLLDRVAQGKGCISIPDGKEERKELLTYMLQAAFSDGEIALEEKRIIQSAAHKMGIDHTIVSLFQ